MFLIESCPRQNRHNLAHKIFECSSHIERKTSVCLIRLHSYQVYFITSLTVAGGSLSHETVTPISEFLCNSYIKFKLNMPTVDFFFYYLIPSSYSFFRNGWNINMVTTYNFHSFQENKPKIVSHCLKLQCDID